MPAIKLIIYFLAAILIGSFAVQNMTAVEVNYYDLRFNLTHFRTSFSNSSFDSTRFGVIFCLVLMVV